MCPLVLPRKNGQLTEIDCLFSKFHWAHVTQIAMPALPIVKTFDVFEHYRSCVVSRSESLPIHALPFEQPEEASYHRVIVAITTGTHAAADTVAL